jgi:peptidoglycan/LPS O-acetylase OafA/YrhL
MEKRRRFSWPSLVFYLFMAMGLVGLMVYITEEFNISETIVITWFWALMGGLSFMMLLRSRRTLWRILTAVAWTFTLIGFGVYLGDDLNLHEGLVMAVVLPSIGTLIYLLFTQVPGGAPRSLPAQQPFRQLGDPESRIEPDLTAAERDAAAARNLR